jgi:transcriptional regulator GlxA family with amidase domain
MQSPLHGTEQIAQAVGCARVTTFDRIFKRAFRHTPSAYRQGVKSQWASSQGEKSGGGV